MPVPLEISIPSTTTAQHPSPHTLYNLTLRLPLRTFTLQKRYSDFVTLHKQLTAQAGNCAPPAPLPGKSIFSSTLKSPALTEQRRAGLEAYLRAANASDDSRWRDTPAWRSFLNLPASTSTSSAASSLRDIHAVSSPSSSAISDPVAWLDTHRELRSLLHSARAHIAARDSSSSPSTALTSPSASDLHAASASAKKDLVRAGQLLAALERGLKENGKEWGRARLGEGEVRRRKDLLAAAHREVDGIENLLVLVRRKGEADEVVAAQAAATSGNGADRNGLLSNGGISRAGVGKGRVLGKETARTKELDNSGVLQLQQQMMRDQDEDVEVLAQAVRRQKELGMQIQEELAVQNEMLGMLEEDVDRVGAKVRVARKKVDKIS